jgi:hypothetical protein
VRNPKRRNIPVSALPTRAWYFRCKVVSLRAVSDALSGDGLQYLQRTVVIEYSKGAQTILAEGTQ